MHAGSTSFRHGAAGWLTMVQRRWLNGCWRGSPVMRFLWWRSQTIYVWPIFLGALLWLPVVSAGASMRASGSDDELSNPMLLEELRKMLPSHEFEAFVRKMKQARKGLCEACAITSAVDDVARMTRAEADHEWEATFARLRSGEPFVITDALSECTALLDPLRTHEYWVSYVERVAALNEGGELVSLPEQELRDEAFASFDSSFASLMHAQWEPEDLAWCAERMNGTECSGGEVLFPGNEIVRAKAAGSLNATKRALQVTLGELHSLDFYTGWSTTLPEVRALLGNEPALRRCLPITGDRRLVVGPAQWWRVGRATHAPVVGEPEHIDMVGMVSECHMQVSGRKLWRLRPPDECAQTLECSRDVEVLQAA